jgi:hypothetical protein
MLDVIARPPVPRRTRLVACAAVRGAGGASPHPVLHAALDTCEAFADRAASKLDMKAARRAVDAALADAERQRVDELVRLPSWLDADVWQAHELRHRKSPFQRAAELVLQVLVHRDLDAGHLFRVTESVWQHRAAPVDQFPADWTDRCRLVHEVFGDPLRPAALDPSWRTEAVIALAAGLYESRDFGPMPVLADALEDAGCSDADVLAHCRGPGPHVRGCWVVDLVLGKD